jgi:hypothetical protein
MLSNMYSLDSRESKKKLGEYYGYPKCCVNHFVDNILYGKKSILEYQKKYVNNYEVSKHTGFIPCTRHTNLILKNKMCLEDLIRNRKCKKKFPNDNDHRIKQFRWKQIHQIQFKKVLYEMKRTNRKTK